MRLCIARVAGILVVLGSLWAGEGAPGPGASPAARGVEDAPLDYYVVVTGGELLEGAYPDGHTHFLTRTLRLLGCRCVGSQIVDDRREDMLEALHFATNRAPLVIMTGGLGPTPNDITREVLAEFTGIRLREDPDAVGELVRRLGQPRDQLRANLRRQCLVPERGGFLKNANGTAVGLAFDLGRPARPGVGSWLIALPGPPRELQPMVRQELVPFLQQRCGVRTFGHSVTLRFVGVGQSQVDQAIKEHLRVAPDVIITSLFEGSRVDFTFALPGHAPEDLARLKRLETELLEHLGDFFYADDGASLEEVVSRRLVARGASVALAEVGSGGQLATALSAVKESSRFIAGACAAPGEGELSRLLNGGPVPPGSSGRERAQGLAEAAARWGRTPWAIAVGGVDPADGKRVVWLAVRSAEGGTTTLGVPVGEAGEVNRAALTTAILDQLRRTLR